MNDEPKETNESQLKPKYYLGTKVYATKEEWLVALKDQLARQKAAVAQGKVETERLMGNDCCG